MSKTPEQMAEEYGNQNSGGECSDDTPGLRDAFLAGYQAAKDQGANVSKGMPKWNSVDTVGDLINRSTIQHTLAALEKNHPAFGFSEIVVKIESGWVSVKDRLPEDGVKVLVVSDGETGASWHEGGFGWARGDTVTHWAPLPKPPEDR